EEELKCVDYFMSSCPIKVMPDNFKYHFESAYKVWKRIFFSGAYRGIKDIDSHLLGIGMRTIRKINGASITLVANILGVDRTTLSHFENGKRIPPLNFLFKFCTLLNYSIEDLLNACIK
ncbi:MAG: helix-turn-helix transcriptional regulator, partial [Bacilli bacterium]|nr:helix-turn-helix transcriptional regulator [Bacilli bacterium]